MRKIKLMALLLAALMIVTAFAGCAGVKQEVVDGLDDRVSKIEDLLLQQNDTIKELGDKVGESSNNSDILAAIESMNKDLSDKIADLDSRVEDVEKQPAVGGVDTNVQAEQTKALAKIDVEKAKFNKNVAEYDEDSFAAITSALAKAQAEVTAATTVEGVAAAMATLEKTLEEYKTYAMKLKDIYDALLGNINDDAEALVEEAEAFIDVIDEVYAESEDVAKDLQYTVVEATETSKAKYLDVYNSVKALIELYKSRATTANPNTATFQYVDTKGVKTAGGSGAINVYSVAGYKAWAKEIVADIEDAVEEGLTYALLQDTSITGLNDIKDDYDDFVKSAELIGGKALVDLVDNIDLLVDAIDLAEELFDARDAYLELNGRIDGEYKDGFYYYTDVAAKAVTLTIVDPEDADEVVYLDTFYKEMVDELIADWIDEFDLSAEDAAAIIDEAEGDGFYDNYLKDRRRVEVVAKAYNTFSKNIVPGIKALNKITGKSADAVKQFNDLVEAMEALYKLQVADLKSENVADQINITFGDTEFGGKLLEQFLVESGVVNVDGIVMAATKNAADGVIEGINEDRVDAVTGAITTLQTIDAEDFVEIFTFASDIKKVDAAYKDTTDNWTTKYNEGEIYKFFAEEYAQVEAFAKDINSAIAYLVENADTISTNVDFIDLAGKYTTLDNADDDFKVVYAKGTASEVVYDNDHDDAATLYVLAANAINYGETYADFTAMSAVNEGVYVAGAKTLVDEVEGTADVLTIDFFNYAFPEFTALIDAEEFEAAQKAADARIQKLFTDVDLLKAALAKIAYVRTAKGEGSVAYLYTDLNKNGVNDFGDEFPYDVNGNGIIDGDEDWSEAETVAVNTISINADNVTAVKNAFKAYNEWTYAGGNVSLEIFAAKLDAEDKAINGLFEMKGFGAEDGVGAILSTLRLLNSEIERLSALAEKFTNAVKYVGEVNKYNSISASISTNKLDNSTALDRLAIYDFAKSSATEPKKYDGIYYYIDEVTTGLTKNNAHVTVAGAEKDETAAGAIKDDGALTKAELIQATVAYYDAFVAANAKYVAAQNNNYDSIEANSATFYAYEKYDAYKAVDDAKATYDAYELIAAKAACFLFAASVKANVDEDVYTSFRDQVNGAPDLKSLENAIISYNKLVATDYVMDQGDLDAWTIYEFKNLPEALV